MLLKNAKVVDGSFETIAADLVVSGETIERIDRFTFYERAQKAFAVVMSGEVAKYGNIILKKGVTPAFVDGR